MSEDKDCFFIAPIGDDGGETRDRTDKLMEYILEKSVTDFGYSIKRADLLDQPGSITNQIIENIVNSELVIADLTDHNPNVFYELAVRHATGKPCLQLIHSTDTIPFDINDERTISYGLEVEQADKAKKDIRRQLDSLEDDEVDFDNPISRSAEMESLRESGDPTDKNLAEILEMVRRMDKKIDSLESDGPVLPDREKMTLNQQLTSDKSMNPTVTINGEPYTIGENPVSRATFDLLLDHTDVSEAELANLLLDNGYQLDYKVR